MPAPDHPRSRGVYGLVAVRRCDDEGSSPLARGLPLRPSRGCRRRRIIPARAGFTIVVLTQPALRRDHPRSRGVYRHTIKSPSLICGSSPLARGLLEAAFAKADTIGIIPARAGFTWPEWVTSGSRSDHPRSRGVYTPSFRTGVPESGSSPLARGLQPPARGFGAAPGIIPARAGFTPPSGRRCSVLPDHPRSRGVYAPHSRRRCVAPGSSPLARGLRLRRLAAHVTLRIIPARAGFTVIRGSHDPFLGDHPRSRGVYGQGSGACRLPR